MTSLILLAVLSCPIVRMSADSCQQCCTSGTVEVCKFIKPCPETPEEKEVRRQHEREQRIIQLQIERERTKQQRLLEQRKRQNQIPRDMEEYGE